MDMKNMPLISVVVPVYNAENCIARCIESVLHQTYSNLELILVDDGSPDDSGAICDEYADKDQRINVIHTPNRGVSCARNTGIRTAKGTYLFFVDSDDWLEPEHIQVLLPIEDEDLVYGGRKMFVNGALIEKRSIQEQVLECSEWLSDYSGFVNRGLAIFFVSGCYRMDIIEKNNILFKTDMNISEDGLFNIAYITHCRKIRYSNSCTYCYEDGDDSSSSLSHLFHPGRLDAEIQKLEAIEDMTQKKEYIVRWREWNGILRHYRKWMSFNKGIHKAEAKVAIKKTYQNIYFRECIPYIRKNGTLDQKVESYFMRYGRYPLYKVCYSVIVLLSKAKQLFR